MFKQKTMTFYRTGEEFVEGHLPLILCSLILSITIIMTFVLQNGIIGFEPGYDAFAPKHHGSVSSKTLAIISNATLENFFVGYVTQFKDDHNNIGYDYFDRYPVFFSALFNRIIALRPKLSSKIYLAKQVMNFIFVATLVVAFLLCDKLVKNKPLSLAAVLIAFANPFLLFYKDMVHFDQPALFGFLLLTYAIALYKIDGLNYPVYIATFISIALGRGYASYAVLGLWLAIEAFLILRTKGLGFRQKIKNVVKHPSFLILALGVVWGSSLLSYNIIIEAQKRNVSILETSILDSAGRRLSLNEEFNQANEALINWPEYTRTEIDRIIKWAFPVHWADPGFVENLLILAMILLIIGIVTRRLTTEKRVVFILLALSGFVWMIPMRNMAAFHDYTTMYFIGIPLAFFLSILVLLKPSRDAAYYLALIGLIVYMGSLSQVKDLHETIAGNANDYTYDYMRIDDAIGSKGNNIYLASKVPYGTNAPEFYLQGQYLAPLSLADYVISDNKAFLPNNLTPENSVMFLFKK